MKKFKGIIVFPLYQEVEIEAESEADARDRMCDYCDVNKATFGDPYVYDCEESDKYGWDKTEGEGK